MAESEQGTGWHGVWCASCRKRIGHHPADLADPVLVVPVGEARETIARVLVDAALDSDGYAGPSALADAVLAALAATPPETEWQARRRAAGLPATIPDPPPPPYRPVGGSEQIAPVSEGGRGDG